MKYLILIYSNPESRRTFELLSDEEQMAFGRGHGALTESLASTGELVVSEGLSDPSAGRRVRVRDGVVSADGPFAEVKEYLAGFYLIECDSLERAIEHAARVPDAKFREVEVRPVMDMRGSEM